LDIELSKTLGGNTVIISCLTTDICPLSNNTPSFLKGKNSDKDLERKRQILNKFKGDPYTPIKDLLNEAADKYGLKQLLKT